MRTGGDLLQLVARLMQHAGHGTGAGRQGRFPAQHVADLLAAPGGIGLLEQEDGALGQVGQLAAARPAAGPIHQPAWPLCGELALPLVERVFGQADQSGKVRRRGNWPTSIPAFSQRLQ
jgi:hypothetical protein